MANTYNSSPIYRDRSTDPWEKATDGQTIREERTRETKIEQSYLDETVYSLREVNRLFDGLKWRLEIGVDVMSWVIGFSFLYYLTLRQGGK